MHYQEILQLEDTIVSSVTAGARSGVSIIRLSGSQAFELAKTCLKNKRPLPAPGNFKLRSILLPSGIEDQALILSFKGPRSLTGEDIVEIHVHGNPLLVQQVIEFLIHQGARQARAGEFLERSLRYGKKSLQEIENLSSLLNARNLQSLKLSNTHSFNKLKKDLLSLREKMINLWAHAEAYFDFSDEEDVSEKLAFSYEDKLSELALNFEKIAQVAQRSQKLHQSNEVCLLGAPNAGKSTLLNSLTGQNLAIVSSTAGTTRDSITGDISLAGYHIRLIDTAGLRKSQCDIEQQGIERSEYLAQNAQVVLYLQSLNPEDEQLDQNLLSFLKNLSCPIIKVQNKIDLLTDREKNSNLSLQSKHSAHVNFFAELSISAKENQGLQALEKALINALGLTDCEQMPYALNERQLQVFSRAHQSFHKALQAQLQPEISVAYLRDSSDILGEVLGDCTSDDILGKIFSQFCIGK